MRPSRGMGCINPAKMPRAKVLGYTKGGEVWNTPNPKAKSTPLTPKQKASAKAQAKAKGQVYPSLVANMRAARSK